MPKLKLWILALCILGLMDSSARGSGPGEGFHVEWYHLDLRPSISAHTVAGDEEIEIKSLTDGLRTIIFSGNGLSVDSVTSEGLSLKFSNGENAFSIELPKALAQGKAVRLHIVYHGAAGTGVKFVQNSVYTIYYACQWMICSQDRFGDKSDFHLDLHVPAGMQSLSVGTLLRKKRTADGGEIDAWQIAAPYSAYLYAFAIGDFATAEESQSSVLFKYVSIAGTGPEAKQLLHETPAMYQFLREKAGVDLPARQYTQLLVPGNEAQEAATFSMIGKDYVDEKNDWVIVHEMSHQWWGNLITCATLKDFWLNEGITSFMVASWQEQHYGRAAYDREMANERTGLEALRAQGGDRPLSFEGEWASGRGRRIIQYGKGALFMDRLRTELGDEKFWAGLRDYTRRYAGKTVTSLDFERAMEQSSGKDLSSLFVQWVFGTVKDEGASASQVSR